MDPDWDGMRRELKAKFDQISRHVGVSTICFNWDKGDRLEQNGTGILLQIAEAHFALTAAHVADELSKNHRQGGINLISGGGVVEQPPIHLDRIVLLSSPASGRREYEDLYDVAVMQLSEHVISRLCPHNRFLSLDEIDLNAAGERESWYYVFGFPKAHSILDEDTRVLRSTAYPVYTTLRKDTSELVFYNETINLALSFNPQSDDESPLPLPPMGGVSGCGIWRIGVMDQPFREWQPADAKLVGIQHKVVSNARVFVGTQIRYALELIWSDSTECRAVIEARWPEASEW